MMFSYPIDNKDRNKTSYVLFISYIYNNMYTFKLHFAIIFIYFLQKLWILCGYFVLSIKTLYLRACIQLDT